MTQRDAARLRGLFFDLDDTLLSAGQLSQEAYSALFRLRSSGLRLIALTGRPASWAEVIARMWPVEAAIAENGALGFRREGERLLAFDTVSSDVRRKRRDRLNRLVQSVLAELGELVVADDAAGRVSDFTFDIGEHECASEETIRAARRMAERQGARTTRSSVHLHFTYDRADKATGALEYLRSRGEDVTSALGQFAFIGDSQNDAACFAAFRTSVGVRNLSGVFSLTPTYLASLPRDAGFCEFADRLCQLRRT